MLAILSRPCSKNIRWISATYRLSLLKLKLASQQQCYHRLNSIRLTYVQDRRLKRGITTTLQCLSVADQTSSGVVDGA